MQCLGQLSLLPSVGRTRSPSHVAWSEGRRPPGAALHSPDEPSELSQWPGHDDSTINIVVVIIIILLLRRHHGTTYNEEDVEDDEKRFTATFDRRHYRAACPACLSTSTGLQMNISLLLAQPPPTRINYSPVCPTSDALLCNRAQVWLQTNQAGRHPVERITLTTRQQQNPNMAIPGACGRSGRTVPFSVASYCAEFGRHTRNGMSLHNAIRNLSHPRHSHLLWTGCLEFNHLAPVQ